MTKEDITKFIEIMGEILEAWTPEAVEEQYGDCATLKDALHKRMIKSSTL